MNPKIVFLLSFLFFKHFLADFVLQDDKIAKEKVTKLSVLFLHAFHHSFLTFAVVFVLGYNILISILVFFTEFVIHAFLDYLKSNNIFYKKAKFPEKTFFYNLGFDQFLHALTYIAIAYFLSL